MNSKDYWQKRERLWQEQQIKDDKIRMAEIKSRLIYARDAIQKEIDAQWQRFSDGQRITMGEAVKMSAESDTQAFARKAKQYVKTKDFSDEANRQLKLYNLTMRVNRLELLRANIGLEMIATFNDLDKYFIRQLKQVGTEEFKRQAGILGMTIQEKGYITMVDKIVMASFNVTGFPTFSENLWMYQNELKADLDKLLIRSITQGVNPRQLSPELKKFLTDEGRENAKFNAQRLMVTETTRIQTAVQEQSYIDAEITEYGFMSEPSACERCLAINGKVFKVADMTPGTNAPSMHPFCRCSTYPVVDDTEFQKSLARRGL